VQQESAVPVDRTIMRPSRASSAGAAPATKTLASLVPEDPAGRDLLARFYRALGDPTRLGLLAFCADDERTGNECVAHAGLSQGRVSAHLACLVNCGLLEVRRAGRFAYYQVTDARVTELVRLGASLVADHAAGVAACTRVASTT
jgi:DNA-binding transcriptional ArsR family regulator